MRIVARLLDKLGTVKLAVNSRASCKSHHAPVFLFTEPTQKRPVNMLMYPNYFLLNSSNIFPFSSNIRA